MNNMHKYLLLLILGLALLLSPCSKGTPGGKLAPPGVPAQFVKGGLTDIGPESKLWAQTPEAVVPMLPQDMTEPKEMNGIGTIRVKSLCDASQVAFLITWQDATKDEIDEGDRFSDAVAIQLPLAAGGEVPNPTMGQAAQPVDIHLWKASYERALHNNGWSLKQDFPNAAVDHYPFDAANDEQKAELAREFTIGLAAGNALAKERTSCVDDLTAEGFGALTNLPAQLSEGSSRYAKGSWSVVIKRPLTVQEWKSNLKPGDNSFVAFAVWDGSLKQAGARKMRSAWVPLRLQKGA